MAHTATNSPPPLGRQPPPSFCTSCVFVSTAQNDGDSKWLLAFKVVSLMLLGWTLIQCFSGCLSKFGYTSSGGQGQGFNGIVSDAKITGEISLTDQNDSVNNSDLNGIVIS